MSLLDQFSNMSPDQTRGLLAAASQILQKSGPSLTPTSFGQIMGSGLQAYQGGMDAARKRKMEEEQQMQMAQLRDLQIQEGTGTLADQTRARQQAEALRKFYMQQANGGAPAAASGLAGAPQQQMASAMPGGDNSPKIGGPGWLQAYQADQGGAMPAAPAPVSAMPAPSAPPMGQSDPYSRQMALAEQLRKGGFYNEADAKEVAALKFRQKFDKPTAVMGPDGKPVLVQISEYGTVRPMQGGYGVAEKLAFQNLGGKTVAVDPYTGKVTMTLNHSQSPDSIAVDRRAAADRVYSPDALLPDDTVSLMAQQYLAGDTSVMQNLGRGAQGAQNIIKLRNEITKQTISAGKGGADLASKNAEFFGTKAGQRAAGTRIANVEMASSEAQSLIPLAREASAAVNRSGLLPFGKAQVMFNNQTNNPELRQFAAANNALVNVYSRAISPSGVPTVADKEHAREMISTAMDNKSYQAVLDQMEREITAARQAPKSVRQAFNDEVTGKDSHAAPQPKPVAKAEKFDMLPSAAQYDGKRMRADNGAVYVSRGGKWVKE